MRSRDLGYVFCLTLLATLTQEADVFAGEEKQAAVMESLPQHLQARLKQLALPDKARADGEHQIILAMKRWPAGVTLKVSFMQGINQDVCKKIANTANEWAIHGNIKFDFGQNGLDKDCRVYSEGDGSDLRISFRYPGYWSMVGTDCRRKALPGEPNMNFEDFDFSSPLEPEFTAIVLHEFGHALGFCHEHQHPFAPCEDEFDWKVVYDRLKAPPNVWDKETVDRNFRRLSYLDGPFLVSHYDKTSVMHYHFDRWMFKSGEKSPCYVARNTQLSNGDKLAMERAYPKDAKEGNKNAINTFQNVLATLPLQGPEKDELTDEVALFARLSEAISRPIVVMSDDRRLNDPAGTYEFTQIDGGNTRFTGIIGTFKVPSINGGSTLDCSQLHAADIRIDSVDGRSRVKLRATNSIHITGKIDGRSEVLINAPRADVIVGGKIDGQSTLTVKCRNLSINDKIDGGPYTKVIVDLTGTLSVSAVSGAQIIREVLNLE
jgi:hypothetical protein